MNLAIPPLYKSINQTAIVDSVLILGDIQAFVTNVAGSLITVLSKFIAPYFEIINLTQQLANLKIFVLSDFIVCSIQK